MPELTPEQKKQLIGQRAGRLVARMRAWLGQVMARKNTVAQLIASCRAEFGAYEAYAQDVIESLDMEAYRKLLSDADGDWTPRSRAQLERIEKAEGKDYAGEVSGGASAFDGFDL